MQIKLPLSSTDMYFDIQRMFFPLYFLRMGSNFVSQSDVSPNKFILFSLDLNKKYITITKLATFDEIDDFFMTF